MVKLKLMLSYLTLYLTLEHGVVPALRALHPLATPRAIDGCKLEQLKASLILQNLTISIPTLKEQIRYGKVLWEVVNNLGVLGLPMLAIGGPGVTSLCRQNGPSTNHLSVLGSRLSSHQTWMALCQAWSPIAIELIFTKSSRMYTQHHLLAILLGQPHPADSIYGLSKYYLEDVQNVPPIRGIGSQVDPPSLNHRQARDIFRNMGIELPLFPQNIYPNPSTHRVALVAWLLEQDEDEELVISQDPAKDPMKKLTTIGLKAFSTLLAPQLITDELVGFLSTIWNGRALPGFGLVTSIQGQAVLAGELGGDPVQSLTIAVGGRRYDLDYENIILPVMMDGRPIPLHISLQQRSATLYKVEDTELHTESYQNQITVGLLPCVFMFKSID